MFLSHCLLHNTETESAKEKVTRIILALFHNLLSNPTEPELAKENALAMVTCKVLKTLELLENRKFEVILDNVFSAYSNVSCMRCD